MKVTYRVLDALGLLVKEGSARPKDFLKLLALLEVRVLKRRQAFTIPLRIERV